MEMINCYMLFGLASNGNENENDLFFNLLIIVINNYLSLFCGNLPHQLYHWETGSQSISGYFFHGCCFHAAFLEKILASEDINYNEHRKQINLDK